MNVKTLAPYCLVLLSPGITSSCLEAPAWRLRFVLPVPVRHQSFNGLTVPTLVLGTQGSRLEPTGMPRFSSPPASLSAGSGQGLFRLVFVVVPCECGKTGPLNVTPLLIIVPHSPTLPL